MGTIVHRNGKYRAVVRKKGVTATKTFTKKTVAKAWMTDTEAAIERRQVFAKGHTLGSILDQYRTEIVEPRHAAYDLYEEKGVKPSDKTHYHLRMLAKQHGSVDLSDMTANWWVETARAMKVAPSSRLKYINHMISALSHAEGLWEVEVDWTAWRRGRKMLDKLRLIGRGVHRVRRLRDGEHAAIIKHRRTETPEIFDSIIDFALSTAMREQEICTLRRADLDRAQKMIWVRKRKHPTMKMTNDWNVPLLGNSFDIVECQPVTSKRIFPMRHDTVQHIFAKACASAGIEDLHFHDLRHEGISRLFEMGYAIQEVALVSGHTDWKSLQIYTQLQPQSLHHGPLTSRGKHTS